MTRPLITSILNEQQLKKLRAKPFPERNKIIQDKLNMEQRERVKKIRMEGNRKNFIF